MPFGAGPFVAFGEFTVTGPSTPSKGTMTKLLSNPTRWLPPFAHVFIKLSSRSVSTTADTWSH